MRKPAAQQSTYGSVLLNAQSELSPLEIGKHALEAVPLATAGRRKTGGLSEYAQQIGKSQPYVTQIRQAAEVLEAVKSTSQLVDLLDKAQHLFAIHAAPSDVWSLLVESMLKGMWSRDDTEKTVKRVNDLFSAIPSWWTVDRLSVAGLGIEGKAQVVNPETMKLEEVALGELSIFRGGGERRRVGIREISKILRTTPPLSNKASSQFVEYNLHCTQPLSPIFCDLLFSDGCGIINRSSQENLRRFFLPHGVGGGGGGADV